MKPAALILAAGYSSRMGSCKPLLEIEGRPMLILAAAAFRSAGIDAIFAVTGWQHEAVEACARSAGIEPIYNPDFAEGMFSSVCAGLKGLPAVYDGAFIHPVDIPLVQAGTIAALYRQAGEHPLLVPRMKGRPGHPLWIARLFFDEVCAWKGTEGLRGFLRSCSPPPGYIDVDDEYMLRDIDTPFDLQSILASRRAAGL